MKKQKPYRQVLQTYISFLKANNLYDPKKKFFYENNIEKFNNWANVDFKKNVNWYLKIKKINKAIVKNIHLEKMKN